MRRVVMVACAALLFVPIVKKSRMSREIPAHAAFRVLSSGRMTVKVTGDVLHPGIYEVHANMLTISAIQLAGPVRPLKQTIDDIACSHPLQNGSVLKLVFLADGGHVVSQEPMTVPEHIVLKIPLEIVAMSEADFERLPGIGPALAKRIVEYRQNNGGFMRVDDLTLVDGIGEKRFKTLRRYFKHPENTE